MKKVKVFTKEACPKCPPAKDLGKDLEDDGKNVEYHDLDTVDGLTEAQIHDVQSTPSIILSDDEKGVVEAWMGIVPEFDDIAKFLTDEE